MKNEYTFDNVQLIKASNEIRVLALNSTTKIEYLLSVNDILELSENSTSCIFTINSRGTYLQYKGDQPKVMYEKTSKLLLEMNWRNNSIYSPESIYNRV